MHQEIDMDDRNEKLEAVLVALRAAFQDQVFTMADVKRRAEQDPVLQAALTAAVGSGTVIGWFKRHHLKPSGGWLLNYAGRNTQKNKCYWVGPEVTPHG
jgi:hypothetical protein